MAWTTPVAYGDVRNEYPLMTVALRANAVVTVDIGIAEDEVEALLRNKYDLTDPGADKAVWRACLVRSIILGLNAVFGSEGWQDRMGSALGMYVAEWEEFKRNILEGNITLSLDPSSNLPLPTVTNQGLATADDSTESYFDLDTNADHGFPLIHDEP